VRSPTTGSTPLTNPRYAEAYFYRGLLYFNNGDVEQALDDYNAAIDLAPTFYEALYRRGYIYARILGDQEQARADFDASIQIHPTAYAHCKRGELRAAAGDVEGGLLDTTRAIELDPAYACAYYSRGNMYLNSGQPEEAVADFSRYLQMMPGDPAGYINRGVALKRLGRYDEALDDYNAAVRLDPQDPMPYANRANLYAEMGDTEAAIADYQTAEQIYRALGQTAKALEMSNAASFLAGR
jgi:tetratricopeptide (TPR) repeat protein